MKFLQVIEEEGTEEDADTCNRPERLAGELLLWRTDAVRRVDRPVTPQHLRALLRRRGGRLGNAQLLQ